MKNIRLINRPAVSAVKIGKKIFLFDKKSRSSQLFFLTKIHIFSCTHPCIVLSKKVIGRKKLIIAKVTIFARPCNRHRSSRKTLSYVDGNSRADMMDAPTPTRRHDAWANVESPLASRCIVHETKFGMIGVEYPPPRNG